MCGLARDLLHGFLGVVGAMAREGLPCPGPGRLGDVIDGKDVEVRPVDPSWHRSLVGWGLWFTQHDQPRCSRSCGPTTRAASRTSRSSTSRSDGSNRTSRPHRGTIASTHGARGQQARRGRGRRHPISSRMSLARCWRTTQLSSLSCTTGTVTGTSSTAPRTMWWRRRSSSQTFFTSWSRIRRSTRTSTSGREPGLARRTRRSVASSWHHRRRGRRTLLTVGQARSLHVVSSVRSQPCSRSSRCRRGRAGTGGRRP